MLEAFGHFGRSDADEQHSLMDRTSAALRATNVPVEIASSGVTMGGGTPAHRWLEVTDRSGERVGLKILVDTEDSIARELDGLAESIGVPREALDVERPPEWPIQGLFGLPR